MIREARISIHSGMNRNDFKHGLNPKAIAFLGVVKSHRRMSKTRTGSRCRSLMTLDLRKEIVMAPKKPKAKKIQAINIVRPPRMKISPENSLRWMMAFESERKEKFIETVRNAK